MTHPNPYPRGTLAHDGYALGAAFREALDTIAATIARGSTRIADRLLAVEPPALDEAARLVGSRQAGEKSSTLATPPAVRVNPTNGDGLTYAERVWLMAPATPWTLDLIRAAWTDDEAIEAAERALRDEVDPEAIADALLAYVDQRDRRHDAEADSIVDEWAAGR